MAETSTYSGRTMGSTMLGVIIGATAGLVTGLLIAPKSGRETREQIKQRANAAKARVANMREKARDKVSEAVSRTKSAMKSEEDLPEALS